MVSQGTLSLRGDNYGIKRSPYEAMFGCVPKVVGLSTTPFPNEILQVLQKAENLQAHLNDKPTFSVDAGHWYGDIITDITWS
jgi:hypothetical protein